MDHQRTNPLLAQERRALILELLATSTSVLVSDLSERCRVSPVTIRADLNRLEAEGKLKRTHGGAVPSSELTVPEVAKRIRKNARAKRAIAHAAARLVRDGENLLVGSGSTTLEFIKALKDRKRLSITTNSCHILEYAEQNLPDITLVSTGGELDRSYRHYFGPIIATSLSDAYFDQVFIGSDGFEPTFGFFAEYSQTARTKVEFLKHARRRVILMDSSKVGARRSYLRFSSPTDVDVVVMDSDPDGIVAAACNSGPKRVEVIEALKRK